MEIKNKRILMIVSGWPASKSGILHSQVLSVAKYLNQIGLNCMFIGCDSKKKGSNITQIDIVKNYDIKASIYEVYNDHLGYIGLKINAKNLFKKSFNEIVSFKPTHIYTRSHVDSIYARGVAKILGAISIYDVRGALADEVKIRHPRSKIRYNYILNKEIIEFRKSIRLSCVSTKLKDYIKKYSGREDIIVIPSCYDENIFYYDAEARYKIRKDFNIYDCTKVICYSGGISKWQRIKDIVSLFKSISNRNNKFKYLFITPNYKEMKNILNDCNMDINNCILVSCLQKDVSKYLSAADAGIIMRNDHIVNYVSSPVKVGEYLSCGLPIILTNNIGDYSEMIQKNKIGMIIDEKKEMSEQIISFMELNDYNEIRNNAKKFSRKKLSIGSNLENYEKLYSL